MQQSRGRWAIACSAVLSAIAVLAATHDVTTTASVTTTAAASGILREARVPPNNHKFEDQVATIRAVQRAILIAAPIDRGIPQGQSRELPQLLRAGHGLCFDRSRAIETVLRAAGYEVRHVYVYSIAGMRSAIHALATPEIPSHSVTEVNTTHGWMVVDSRIPWLGLTIKREPVSIRELKNIDQSLLIGSPYPLLRSGEFNWLYGLYSRHGRFYPPYNFVPDVNWREMAHNI